jgi:multiple sugar transport system substrate-binding protein
METLLRSRITLLCVLVLCFFTLTGFGCRRNVSVGSSGTKIVVWGLWQDSTAMDPVIKAFKTAYGADVEYKKIGSVADYEKTLLEALAQGQGPDVFVIHHTWVEGKRGLMSPAPADIIDERAVKQEFVDVIDKDLVRDNSVYALPVSVDTMALYYNKDLLNAAGVARPPATWDEFQQAVQKITRVTRFGTILQSAAALGTAANINRAPDIVQMLMLQSGLDIKGATTSDQVKISDDIGQRALTFYTDFANKAKQVFTWDLQQDYSLDAFAAGKTAMMINYSYHIPTIQAKNPRLQFNIAPVPQIADSKVPVTFASYWPFAVSTTSKNPRVAWQFIRFLTSSQAVDLLNKDQINPPARRDGVDAASRDPLYGVFAEQSLTASSWPRVDIVATDAIFNKMIDDVVTGAASIEDSLHRGEDQLNQLGVKQ